MKYAEIKDMSAADLIKAARRDVARLMTALRQSELNK